MTDLTRIHRIDQTALSGTDYVSSLLTQGRLCGLLSGSDIAHIQSECLALLAELAEKWNRGKSSSIRLENAQELLCSILYTVGIALKALPSPEDAVGALKQEPLGHLFQTGLKRIRRKVQTARLMHRQLLCGLDENYRQLLLNIYEPVLAAALSCILTGQPVRGLSCNRDALQALLDGKNAEEIELLLAAALGQMAAELGCSPSVAGYLKSSLTKLAASILTAMELGYLEAVILTPTCPENKPQVHLSYGERMDDRDYARILDELLWSGSAAEKAEILLRRIHSPGDLLEILRDAGLTQKELTEMFRHFPPEIIAVLLRQYPNGDLLTDEREIIICSALHSFYAALPDAAREHLEKAAEALQFDP